MAQQDEGIMALMGAGQDPQGATPEDPPIDMAQFRKEAYPVFKDSIREISPEAYQEMDNTLSMELDDIDEMDPEALQQLLEIVEYINDNPQEYEQVRSALISADIIDEDDFPAEMDVEYFATMEVVLREAAAKQEGMAAQVAQGPVEMAPPQGFAKGGIAEAAKLVASKGRYGDTMLAHITPDEAKLLKARGGSGTINPETGLPEFFLKRAFRAVRKAVKSVVKSVKKVVKSVVSSPIGRMVATVGLSMIGVPPPVASALVTKAGGGSWKDALKSAAVSYLGGPTSPIASTVARFTPFLNTLSPGVAAGIRSGITSTGAALLTGANLKDAVTSGLTTGLMTGLQARQEGAPVSDAAAMTPEQILRGDGTAPVAGGTLPTGTAIDPMTGAVTPVSGGTGAAGTPLGPLSPDTAFAAATNPAVAGQAPVDMVGGLRAPDSFGPPSGVNYGLQAPTIAPGAGSMFPGGATTMDATAMATPGAAPAAVGGARPVMTTLGDVARGAGQVLSGDFREGFSTMGTGLRDTFMPTRMSTEQLTDRAIAIQQDVASRGGTISFEAARKMAAEANPGIMRTYAPAAAAGLGIMALTGGFEQKPLPESQFGQQMRTPIDVPPSLQRPIQNLPGVVYDDQGNIIGSTPWNPASGISAGSSQVATPGIMSLMAPPNYSVPMGAPTSMRMGSGMLPQPFNTAMMYSSLMPPRRFNAGGVAALAQGGYPRRIGQIEGPGTETSDDIPAMLSDGEFVMTARAVRGAGNGSRREGAKKMYAMMHQLEQNAARG
jgi:hypothetical protein